MKITRIETIALQDQNKYDETIVRVLGPIYSIVYTDVAIHPDGFLAKVTAPDPNIPKGVENASWIETPSIWWKVVERLSWTMLAKHKPGCQFRPVLALDK
jgi:hypothetical protein